MPDMLARGRLVLVTALAAMGAVVVAPPREAAANDDACQTEDVDYQVHANVYVRDTPFGAGNGVYPFGAGLMRLRVEGPKGHASVTLMSYETENRLTVDARVAMLSTKVVTTSRTTTAPDACLGSAQGSLRGNTLTWTTKVAGYRSDGTIECSGSICGAFGVPPKGTTPLHDASPSLAFGPFTFSPDGSTFTMPYTLVSRSASPPQTTLLALSGRRIKGQCMIPSGAVCGGSAAKTY